MKIKINGQWQEVEATTLDALLAELGLTDATVATARNHEFVRVTNRDKTVLNEGDQIEILTPMQGG